jgi:hypothetical protein
VVACSELTEVLVAALSVLVDEDEELTDSKESEEDVVACAVLLVTARLRSDKEAAVATLR